MSDATYGALLADAEHQLVRAIFTTREPFRSANQARQTADDYAQILFALKDGIRTLGGVATPGEAMIVPPATSRAGALFRALDDSISRFAGSTEMGSSRGEWNACARAISAGTALLASHLGPDRTYRTPDAPLLDDTEIKRAGVHRLAIFALTAAEGGRPLALRIRDASIRFPKPGQLRTIATWLMTAHTSVGEAAAGVINDLHPTAGRSHLSMLQPAPQLVPTHDSDPIAAARKSFDQIRLIAHRQARGEFEAGLEAIRAYATTGLLVAMHSHAITSAVAETHKVDAGGDRESLLSMAESLLATRTPWANLLAAAEQCGATTYSPPLLGREVTCLSSNLGAVTRSATHWLLPTEMIPNVRVEQRLLQLVHHLGSRVPDLAAAVKAITERLYEQGHLLVPTRSRDDLDLPYRWAPISPNRIGALRDASRTAQAAAAKAAALTNTLLFPSRLRQPRAVTPSRLVAPKAAASPRSVG